MGDCYDNAPPGWGKRGPTPIEELQVKVKELEARIRRLEMKDVRFKDSNAHG